MLKLIPVFTLSLVLAGNVAAALKFEKSEVEVAAKPEESQVSVEFRFKNTGEEALDVVDVSYACSCLSAGTDKDSYAPGEEGQ